VGPPTGRLSFRESGVEPAGTGTTLTGALRPPVEEAIHRASEAALDRLASLAMTAEIENSVLL
jgi:hypothetical protein